MVLREETAVFGDQIVDHERRLPVTEAWMMPTASS
jgi:hypothetical protein